MGLKIKFINNKRTGEMGIQVDAVPTQPCLKPRLATLSWICVGCLSVAVVIGVSVLMVFMENRIKHLKS